LQYLGKRLNDRNLRDKAFETLLTIEEHGGEEVVSIIESKAPTYQTKLTNGIKNLISIVKTYYLITK
jgi:hypothetical protein